MKLNELIKMVEHGTPVALYDNEGEEMATFTRTHYGDAEVTEAIENYGGLDVEGVGVDDNTLVVGVEVPTFKITGTYTVTVEVLVTAMNEDEAFDKLAGIDPTDELDYADGVDEVYSTEYGEFEWDDARRW